MLTLNKPPAIVGEPIDTFLAPLDELYPVAELPSPADTERAYALGMLAADLTMHAPSNHLLAVCEHLGWEPGEALTIGRALASLLTRIAMRANLPHSDAL